MSGPCLDISLFPKSRALYILCGSLLTPYREIFPHVCHIRSYTANRISIPADDPSPIRCTKTIAELALSRFGTTFALSRVEESFDVFMARVLCTMQGTSDFTDANTRLIQTHLSNNATLMFMSYTVSKGNEPRNLKLRSAQLSRVTWPSLIALEEASCAGLPEHSIISEVIRSLVALPPYAQTTAVSHILETLRFEALQLAAGITALRSLTHAQRHPVAVYLWLSVYLAQESVLAAHALVSGGLVRYLQELYDANFGVDGGQALYDLSRLSYIVLRVLSRLRSDQKQDTHDDELQTLKEELREDIRHRSRVSCEHYHYYCDFYEVQAELRDKMFLESIRM